MQDLESAPELHTMYRVFAQIAGIYAESASLTKNAKFDPTWLEQIQNCMTDLANICSKWEEARKTKQENDTPDMTLVKSLERLSKRISIVESRMHTFMPMRRWVQILSLIEAQWQRQLRLAQAFMPQQIKFFNSLSQSGDFRQNNLDNIKNRLNAQSKHILNTYAIPKPIHSQSA